MAAMDYEIEDDSYYLFACAELKSRENEFISQSRLDRMAAAVDIEEFYKVLQETVYSSDIGGIRSKGSFEEVIISSYRIFNEYLENRLKEEHLPVVNILFFEEFLHNMKLILKTQLLETDFEYLYIPVKYEYSQLIDSFKKGKYEGIAEPLPGLIEYLREISDLTGDRDFKKIELDFEAFYIKRMMELAESFERKMIVDYIREKIDLINIETIYRHRQLKEKGPFMNLLHAGGNLKLKVFKDLESESMDYIVREFERTDYGDVIIKGAQRLFSDCSFSSFERNRDIYFLEYFDRIKYSVSNLEKIFQFFLKKKIELIYVNILYTGILYSADKSNLKCRID